MCFWIIDNFLKKTDFDVEKQKIKRNYTAIDQELQKDIWFYV